MLRETCVGIAMHEFIDLIDKIERESQRKNNSKTQLVLIGSASPNKMYELAMETHVDQILYLAIWMRAYIMLLAHNAVLLTLLPGSAAWKMYMVFFRFWTTRFV